MVDLKDSDSLHWLLEQVVLLSRNAGKAIMEIYSLPTVLVTQKGDTSPLTAADMASHHAIAAGLGKLTPEWPVLSEEAESTPFDIRREWPTFWLVDPLDGTKEFLKRNGEFTVNIALVEGEIPVLGVVYAPATDKMYFAARGAGAFRQENGKTDPIRVLRGHGGDTRVITSRSHGVDEKELYTSQFGRCEFIPMGSSLKFCLVAEGSADVYPRFGPTMEWDTAAAHCILNEAGGTVTSIGGAPLTYNKADLHNPFFVARGTFEQQFRGVGGDYHSDTLNNGPVAEVEL